MRKTSSTDLYEQAYDRMAEFGFTPYQFEFLFNDWAEGDEHLEWLLTASREEIVDWGEHTDWGRL